MTYVHTTHIEGKILTAKKSNNYINIPQLFAIAHAPVSEWLEADGTTDFINEFVTSTLRDILDEKDEDFTDRLIAHLSSVHCAQRPGAPVIPRLPLSSIGSIPSSAQPAIPFATASSPSLIIFNGTSYKETDLKMYIRDILLIRDGNELAWAHPLIALNISIKLRAETSFYVTQWISRLIRKEMRASRDTDLRDASIKHIAEKERLQKELSEVRDQMFRMAEVLGDSHLEVCRLRIGDAAASKAGSEALSTRALAARSDKVEHMALICFEKDKKYKLIHRQPSTFDTAVGTEIGRGGQRVLAHRNLPFVIKLLEMLRSKQSNGDYVIRNNNIEFHNGYTEDEFIDLINEFIEINTGE